MVVVVGGGEPRTRVEVCPLHSTRRCLVAETIYSTECSSAICLF